MRKCATARKSVKVALRLKRSIIKKKLFTSIKQYCPDKRVHLLLVFRLPPQSLKTGIIKANWLFNTHKFVCRYKLLEVKLPYDPVCQSVGRFVGRAS